MKWKIEYLPEAEEDVQKLDGSVRKLVVKAIEKVSTNPLPAAEGGYGKPLGHNGDLNLTGFYKIKLKRQGIRVVYSIVRENDRMTVIIVGARSDEEVYKYAYDRLKKYRIV